MAKTDVNFDYSANSKTPLLVSGLPLLKNKIKRLLLTPLGTSPRRRDWGSSALYFLQEDISPQNASLLASSLYQALTTQLADISINQDDLVVLPVSNLRQAGYSVKIKFTERSTNVSDTVELLLEQG